MTSCTLAGTWPAAFSTCADQPRAAASGSEPGKAAMHALLWLAPVAVDDCDTRELVRHGAAAAVPDEFVSVSRYYRQAAERR